MNPIKTYNFFRHSIRIAGIACFIGAVINLNNDRLTAELALLFLFTLTVGTRLSLFIMRSSTAISFSDAAIFLCFISFGGEAAIILGSLEALVTSIFMRRKYVHQTIPTIIFNFAMTAFGTSLTYLIWRLFSSATGVVNTSDPSSLIITLSVLATGQFFTVSSIVAIYYSLKTGENVWEFWKRECVTNSLPQIVGASLAGVFYTLITHTSYIATAVVFSVIGIIYFNYRRFVSEINSSIEQVENAERDKAEAERIRAEQAEKHNETLVALLHEQEQITEQLRISKDSFEHAALHDSLTKLANRAFLTEKLEFLLEMSKNISASKFYVLFLDLAKFKNINDSLGHAIGDKFLILVAKRILRAVNTEDTVARLGGDEFAVIISDPLSVDRAEQIAHDIHKKLSQPFSIRGNRIFTQTNIGLAQYDAEHKKPEEILRDADIAMHYAREKSLSVAVFDKELRRRFLENIGLESDLRFAVERGELSMYYQPLISLRNGDLRGFEALLRWNHPNLGFVSPAKFIPIAEDSGLIIPITDWILQQTCEKLAKWQKILPEYKNLMVSVNLSGKHLAVDSLVDEVAKVLGRTQIKPETLKLEVTETSAMENAEQSIKILTDLKNLGVRLSIDDFGTGYSSLNQLHRLPFDMLKIDRSFVSAVGENGENAGILQTIVSLAKNLRMQVVAEGIETENQLEMLRTLGCDYAQGYLLAKPMPAEIMEEMLYAKRTWFPDNYVPGEFGGSSISVETVPNESIHVF